MDDVLIFSDTLEEHVGAVRAFFERCRAHGISLNRAKTRLAREEVKFAGYVLSREGVKADPAKLSALHSFPQPTNLTDLAIFSWASRAAGRLLEGDSRGPDAPQALAFDQERVFVWTEDHSRAFERVKKVLFPPPFSLPST